MSHGISSPRQDPVLIPRSSQERLSLPLAYRLPLSVTIGGFSGLFLGMIKGAQDSGLRFQAENAHRLPVSQTGWFLYHKSKNYNMMLGGILEGFRQSFKYSIWVGLYFVLEEGVDRGRSAGSRMWHMLQAELQHKDKPVEDAERVQGSRDCISSMLAGLGTAGMFSAWNRFPVPTTARTARLGAKAGLAFGLLQDAVGLLKGRRIGYVEFIKRHTVGTAETPSHAMVT